MQPPPTSPTSNLSAKRCHCRCLAGLQHSTFPKVYTRPKHRTHTQLYGDATESAVTVGLGRLLYTAGVMDGESVPIWLNFGVGKGLLCSPKAKLGHLLGYSWASSRLQAVPADGHPLRDRAALPGPPWYGRRLEEGLFCKRPQEAVRPCENSSTATSRGKSRAVPTPLCYKGQSPPSVR